MTVNGIPLTMELDTGAAVSVISAHDFKATFGYGQFQKTDLKLRTYTGEEVAPLGVVQVQVQYNNQAASLPLYVVHQPGPPLLGRQWLRCIRLDWPSLCNFCRVSVPQDTAKDVKRKLNLLLDKYGAIFKDELGTVKGEKAQLFLKDGSRPKFMKARSVPIALQPAVEQELLKLQDLGIINPVPVSEFATPIVPVIKKDGSLRICGDYKTTVNPMLDIDHYPLPKIEELLSSLAGGQKFSKIDLSRAYQQIEMCDESKKYLTLNTHKGLFEVNRRLFGIASAPGIFQRIMENVLKGLPKVCCYLDDLLITGSTPEEHLANLDAVLKRLLCNKATWLWSPECEHSFNKIKEVITTAPVLAHYSSYLPLQLASDASPYGVGAVLSHKFPDGTTRPIAYASRTLTKAEQGYSQLEREALALVFGFGKFHYYLYGRSFTLITDHKPLQTIFGPKTGIPTVAAARLQRWAVTLAAYRYTLLYKEASKNVEADCLSRMPLTYECNETADVEMFYTLRLDTMPLRSSDIARETGLDPTSCRVREMVMRGWPSSLKDPELKPYFDRKLELTVHQGCLLYGMRVVVPGKFQTTVLSELHDGHPGIVRTKVFARSYVWWPSLERDIEECVKTCLDCQQVQPAPPKSPLHPWSWPTAPWHRLHADFAGPFKGHMFLIVMDAHSKWPEVFIMGKTTTKHTIEKLHELFSRFGIPESFVTDNGPQFVSQEFKDFLKKMGIRHVTTTPYHTSSNGLAERFVQSLKTALRKGYEFHQSRAPQLCGVVIKINSGYTQAEPLPKRQSATTIQVPGLQHLRTSNSRIFPAPLRYSQQVTGPAEPCSDPALRNPFRTALEFHSRLLKKEDTLSETDVLPSVIKLISFVLGAREVSCYTNSSGMTQAAEEPADIDEPSEKTAVRPLYFVSIIFKVD
ncbi:uncharacterized protein K02A2.6-like [Ornithodoros turicata]|uniref:uncharacterized protein K02A2.6-like n=1 Tax=Ornithodoros turicata TaxID=34597 RepID=UPI003138FF2E